MAADKRKAEIKAKGTQLSKEKEQLQKDLANYCLSQAGVTALPIPVQEIAELTLGLQRQAMQCFEVLSHAMLQGSKTAQGADGGTEPATGNGIVGRGFTGGGADAASGGWRAAGARVPAR